MKKVLLFPLTIIAGALAIGYASNAKSYQPVKADERVYHIEMNADAFTDYAEEKGSFANADAIFWGDNYSFNALEPFFRGETAEGWTGSLTLKSWKQYSQFIRFQWGGAHNIEDQIKLEIHYGEYVSSMFNETFSENPMMMDYFKIPDEQYALLDKENGFDMYITFVDNRTSDYGFHNFGCLYVNQSEEEVSNAMRYYLNHINLSDTREWKLNNNRTIYNFYLNNDRLKSVFLKTVNNADEDFEDINAFLNHWYIDVNYGNNAGDARHVDNLLSNRAVRDGSNMPFNKTGASFFSGWHEALINQGYVASDYPTYRFVSRPFVLSGTGLVSVKMAGRSASLHVIDAQTQEDLAWADLKTFSNGGDENRIYSGFNTVTMVTHYINLSNYLGKTIQLAVADVYEDNWASSYFDELVTNYETYPTFGIDVLFQDNNEDKTYSYWFDQYIAATHIDNDAEGLKYKLGKDDVTYVDESPIYEAYKFLKHYYAALRSPDNEFDYSKASRETRRTICDEYKALSASAKQIVDNSSDLKFSQPFDADWHKKSVDAYSKISTAISSLVDEFNYFQVSFSANGGTGEMASVGAKGEYRLPTCTFIAPTGKEFAGWKIGGTGDTLLAGQTIDVTADIELVAQWKDVKYIITFDANGGTGTMANVEVNKGQQLTLPECTFVAPQGKEFDCWIVKRERHAVGDKVDITGNTEVFAEWKRIPVIEESYTVSYSANGGTGEMASVNDVKGDYTLPSCSFSAPEGQEFKCWLIGNEEYQPGQVISVDQNITVVASWKVKEVLPPEPGPGGDDSSSMPPSSSEEGGSSSEETPVEPTTKKGCSGEILLSSTSVILASSLVVLLLANKRRKQR